MMNLAVNNQSRFLETPKVLGSIAVLFALSVVAHASMNLSYGDFLIFQERAINFSNVFSYVAWNYVDHSPRIFIEGAIYLLLHATWLWYVIDTLMWPLLFVAIISLFPAESRDRLAIPLLLLLLTYPYYTLNEAGWFAVTINYLWPLTLGLCAISLIVSNHTTFAMPLRLLIITFCVCFAASFELMWVVLLCVLGTYCAISIKNGRAFSADLFLALAICIVFGLVILLAPGVSNRASFESEDWWPDAAHFNDETITYAAMSPFYKIYLSIATTLDRFYFSANSIALFLILSLVLTFALCKGNSFKFIKVAGAINALLLAVLFVIHYMLIQTFLPAQIVDLLTRPKYDLTPRRIAWILLEICSLICIVVQIVVALKGRRSACLLAIGVFALGFATHAAMAFSPTLFASGERTFIFMDASLIVGILLLWNTLKLGKHVFSVSSVISFLCLVSTVLYMICYTY